MKKLIFVDAGVLIAAARGNDDISERAMEILDDSETSFGSSIFVKLEVLPKPMYQNRKHEVMFYETFFDNISIWAEPSLNLIQNAYKEAVKLGLSAIDALHVSAASAIGADELVTSEGITKPIHKSKLVRIRTIVF